MVEVPDVVEILSLQFVVEQRSRLEASRRILVVNVPDQASSFCPGFRLVVEVIAPVLDEVEILSLRFEVRTAGKRLRQIFVEIVPNQLVSNFSLRVRLKTENGTGNESRIGSSEFRGTSCSGRSCCKSSCHAPLPIGFSSLRPPLQRAAQWWWWWWWLKKMTCYTETWFYCFWCVSPDFFVVHRSSTHDALIDGDPDRSRARFHFCEGTMETSRMTQRMSRSRRRWTPQLQRARSL